MSRKGEELAVHRENGRLYLSYTDFIDLFEYRRQSVYDAKSEGKLDDAEIKVEGGKAEWLDVAAAVRVMENKGNIVKHRTRKTKEEADKLEMENSTRRGELLNAGLIESALYDITKRSTNHYLLLPDRVASPLTAMTDENEINKFIKDEVDKILAEEVHEIEALIAPGGGNGKQV